MEPEKEAADASPAVAGYGKALRDAHRAIETMSAASVRTSLDARRALFALRDGRVIPSDVGHVLGLLAAFERSLVETDEDAVVERKRDACLQALDKLIAERGFRKRVA